MRLKHTLSSGERERERESDFSPFHSVIAMTPLQFLITSIDFHGWFSGRGISSRQSDCGSAASVELQLCCAQGLGLCRHLPTWRGQPCTALHRAWAASRYSLAPLRLELPAMVRLSRPSRGEREREALLPSLVPTQQQQQPRRSIATWWCFIM